MSHSATSAQEPSLSDLFALILARRRPIVRTALLAGLLVGTVLLLLPRSYSVDVSVLPIAPGLPGGRVAGLAAQFGLGALSAPAGQSPDFYAAYLQSREIRLRALDKPIKFVRPKSLLVDSTPKWGEGQVLGVLGASANDSLRAREQGIEALLEMTTVTVDRLAGTVNLRVRTPWPTLSKELAEIYLALLMEFNHEQRQSQASAERRFIEARISTAKAELQASERRLQSFLERNRTWHTAPALVLEHDRHRRAVELRQSVVSSLAQSYEQARLDEVRDTPLLTVVQRAALPGAPDRRGLVLKVLGATLVGGFLSVVFVVIVDLVSSAKHGRRHSRQLSELLDLTAKDIRSPWRLII